MPDLAISLVNSDQDNTFLAINYLVGVMLAPDDEAKQRAYEAAIFGRCARGVTSDPELGDVQWPGDIVRQMLNAPEYDGVVADLFFKPGARSPAKTETARFLFAGTIVGYAVLIPILLRFRHGIVVGRTAAFRILEQWLSNENRLVGARIRNLQNFWKSYQSAAHLWAAFILLDEHFPADFTEFIGFLCVSEFIRNLAERHNAPHSREMLLDARLTWKVPQSFVLPTIAVDLGLFDIPENWIRSAKTGAHAPFVKSSH